MKKCEKLEAGMTTNADSIWGEKNPTTKTSEVEKKTLHKTTN